MKVPYKVVLASVAVLVAVTGFVILLPTHKSTPATHYYPLSSTPTKPVEAPQTAVPVETAPVTAEVFTDVNNERVKAGLSALVDNPGLDRAANDKCTDMATRNYWSHNTPDGVEPWQFILNEGVSYQAAGENLEYGYRTSDKVVAAWMASPGHRENILRANFTDVGTAVCAVHGYTSGGGFSFSNSYIAVQEFTQTLY